MKNTFHAGDGLLFKLVALKAVMLLAAVTVVFTVYHYFDMDLPYAQIGHVLGFGFVLVCLWVLRLTWRMPVMTVEVFLLLLSDLVMLVLLVDHSGGSANPFASSMLVPLALAAALLPKFYSLGLALIAVLVYAYWTFAGDGQHMDHSNFSLHLYGMWINFLLCAIILFVFITYAMDSLKQREAQLQSAREKILRDEQLVAMATITATTAHALGSPLSTMAILVDEWVREGRLDGDSQIFKEQLDVCKSYLANIGKTHQELGESYGVAVRQCKDELQARIQLLHPASDVAFTLDASLSTRILLFNHALLLGLVNLVENALQAASDKVTVHFCAADEGLCIAITDNGEGLSPELKATLGQAFIASKKGGWGLGVYLSNSTVEQFGGSISIRDAASGGTETLVFLPLEAITSPPDAMTSTTETTPIS